MSDHKFYNKQESEGESRIEVGDRWLVADVNNEFQPATVTGRWSEGGERGYWLKTDVGAVIQVGDAYTDIALRPLIEN